MKGLGLAAAIALTTVGSGCIIIEDFSQIPYEYCTADRQCSLSAPTCYLNISVPSQGAKGNLCSVACTDMGPTSQCPADGFNGFAGSCYSIEGSPRICWQRCIDNFDCRSDFFCAKADDGFGIIDTICVPGTGF